MTIPETGYEAWNLAILIARMDVYDLMTRCSQELRELESTQNTYNQEEYIYSLNNIQYHYTTLIEELDFYEEWLFNIKINTYTNIRLREDIKI